MEWRWGIPCNIPGGQDLCEQIDHYIQVAHPITREAPPPVKPIIALIGKPHNIYQKAQLGFRPESFAPSIVSGYPYLTTNEFYAYPPQVSFELYNYFKDFLNKDHNIIDAILLRYFTPLEVLALSPKQRLFAVTRYYLDPGAKQVLEDLESNALAVRQAYLPSEILQALISLDLTPEEWNLVDEVFFAGMIRNDNISFQYKLPELFAILGLHFPAYLRPRIDVARTHWLFHFVHRLPYLRRPAIYPPLTLELIADTESNLSIYSQDEFVQVTGVETGTTINFIDAYHHLVSGGPSVFYRDGSFHFGNLKQSQPVPANLRIGDWYVGEYQLLSVEKFGTLSKPGDYIYQIVPNWGWDNLPGEKWCTRLRKLGRLLWNNRYSQPGFTTGPIQYSLSEEARARQQIQMNQGKISRLVTKLTKEAQENMESFQYLTCYEMRGLVPYRYVDDQNRIAGIPALLALGLDGTGILDLTREDLFDVAQRMITTGAVYLSYLDIVQGRIRKSNFTLGIHIQAASYYYPYHIHGMYRTYSESEHGWEEY